MTPEEKDKWELTLSVAKDEWGSLSEWEQNFMVDMESKVLEWGDRARISEKQMAVLDRIYDKCAPC